MKNRFRGFYTPKEAETESIWNSPKTLFVFDANCLLNLYRCEKQTREDIFSVMEKIKERSWFPFQACFEYQKRRITVINDSINTISEISNTLSKISSSAENALSDNGVKKHLYTRLSEELDAFRDEINKPIKKFIETNINPRLKLHQDIAKKDFVRERIDKIVGDNCGTPPTQEMVEVINKEGEDRYLNKIPPGFKDDKKKATSRLGNLTLHDKFGDLYIWKEIIEKAKDPNIEHVVYITDDQKDDWWFITHGKPKGPLEALQTEIYSNTEIKNFKLVTQSTFLFEAGEYLKDIKIDTSSVAEMEAIMDETRKYNNLHESLNSQITALGYESIDSYDEDSYEYPIYDIKFMPSLQKNNDYIDIPESDLDKYHNESILWSTSFIREKLTDISKKITTLQYEIYKLLKETEGRTLDNHASQHFNSLRMKVASNINSAKFIKNQINKYLMDDISIENKNLNTKKSIKAANLHLSQASGYLSAMKEINDI